MFARNQTLEMTNLQQAQAETNANDGFPQVEFKSGDDTWSLLGDTDRSTWTSFLQEIITSKASTQDSANQEAFSIPTLGQDPRTSELLTVSAPAKVSFFAGVLLTSKSGHNIGALCVVDTVERSQLTTPEVKFLNETARRCMNLLGLARERGFHSRWTAVQEELDTFLKSRTIHAQLLEEPKTPAGLKPSREEEDGGKKKQNGAEWTKPKTPLQEPFAGLGTTPVEGPESERLVDAEVKRDYRIAARENQPNNETLVEIDLKEEERRLTTTFKDIRQLIFKPLTDPTSLKRLGACFAWRMKPIPVFTDAVDLSSMKAFIHVVESELARHDASHVAKQKETFVSSVSHELRTPLHGILGAVQLLDESGLDPMQRSLASIITTCGSTLHETLTSVLSYAKINQFERRQHEYRNRPPPDTVWALSAKEGLASGPDRDYEGLYICTNLALLCEEILGVLEAGKSFQSSRGGDVIVVCNIDYEDNWDYYTEPGALRRIAVNLIGNALKYTESGSVIATLSASKMIQDPGRVSNDLDTGRTLNLRIKDTGRGMSKDFMDNQLFLPFTQEDSTSTHGVGLGMSIVKSLISLLGGEIQVRSEEKNGTEIDVRVPMRMCKPEDDEKGHAAVQFEKDIQTIRDRKLSTVIYGFPDFVRDSLQNYLCDWYGCELLEPTKDAKPDIVLVDEGNEDVLEAVKETAHGYGKQGVLLSIVMVPSRLGKRMDTIDGYIKWERIPRPLGPNNVAKGLLSCLEKLDELRKYGENATVDKEEDSEEPESKEQEPDQLQKLIENLPDEQFMPSLEKLLISESSQSPLISSASPKQPPNSSESSGNKDELSDKSTGQKVEPKLESKPPLRILVVDDNALNLRLLGAFFKKTGYRNTQQAKQGREAVEAVQNSGEGFDIIFMDLSMPVMDGFEATRQIRKMEDGYDRAPATKKDSVIIALTGLASREDEDEAFKAGVDLFLTKPVQFPKLSNLLRQYEEGTLKRRRRSDGSC
ncbi:hypothetical protein N0V86_008148 [Didymella sp. IMI 355093]|nr:hypothetical protein N0V86_008148 [Didymella sp. IMI 355093]